MNLVFWIL